MANTRTAKKKNNTKVVILSFMANAPIAIAGILLGASFALHFDAIDFLPMFTLIAFIFYTFFVIVWRLIGFVGNFRFFRKLSVQLLYYEAVFLILVYAFTLYVDYKMFPIDSLL